MYEEYEGGEDLRTQSHVHRRRSAKRNGVAYPSDMRQAAASPSVLQTPALSINGASKETWERQRFGQPTTGSSATDLERRMYGIYNRHSNPLSHVWGTASKQ